MKRNNNLIWQVLFQADLVTMYEVCVADELGRSESISAGHSCF